MKLIVLVGAACAALLALASPAAASSTTCNSSTPITGAHFSGDLVVPANGECTIIDSTVGDDVKVGKNAYFQSTNSQIADDVEASRALTLFFEKGSTVGGHISASKTAQVFIFDSTVNGSLEVNGTTEQVNICGNTVDGRIQVKDSGRDILIGDPLTVGCAGNTVLNQHRIRVEDNFVDVELVVRGNTVQGGDLEVNDNKGPAGKFVENNQGGNELECHGNSSPFTAGGNTGWNKTKGQCAIPPTVCNSPTPQIGAKIEGDLVVPENGECTIQDSTVGGDVKVGRNAYFQATNSQIAGDVNGRNSLTVFIDSQTTVGGEVGTSNTSQVFVFNASVGDEIDVTGSTAQVNICGNQVTQDLEVKSSGRDILVGDPNTAGCAGNTVGGDIEVERNNVDVELVVSGNTVGDDLVVRDNKGTANKFVQNNTGGDRLSCSGNQATFTGAPNAGFASTEGQCALI
jgi:hypothetical protein